ncbi:MAG: AzlC family ABC transporter permease [Azospirillaceae bacterium]
MSHTYDGNRPRDEGSGGDPASPRRHPLLAGMRAAVGVPALVLAASYLGFGSLVRSSGLGLPHGMASTVTGWALPGQVALVELYAAGASVLTIALAVGLTNARLMPMTISLMPWLRARGRPRWQYFAAAHLVAVTGWVHALRHVPAMAERDRLPYFAGFSLTLWGASLSATAGGFVLAGAVPPSVSLGLVFFNPIYFMLVLGADAQTAGRARAWALGAGALAGPLFHRIDPDWGLLATGLVAGTAAFLADRLVPRRGAGSGADTAGER